MIFGPLFDCIAAEAHRFFSLLVKKITENIPKEYLIFGGVFTYGMYHLSPIELEHIDYNDFGICVVGRGYLLIEPLEDLFFVE